MSDTPVAEQAAERESLKTRNWVLGSALAILFLAVQALIGFNISSAMSKADQWNSDMKETKSILNEVLTAQKVQQVESQMAARRQDATEKTDIAQDQRLKDLEQRQAITDAYMSTHK